MNHSKTLLSLALAAADRALRLIWTGNIKHIYDQVAPQSIACERHARKFREDQRGCSFESDSWSKIHHRRSGERVALEKKIWKHIEHVFHEIYNEDAEYVWAYAKEEGFLSSLVVWDHWQPSLREVICQGLTTNVWNDSSDEDI